MDLPSLAVTFSETLMAIFDPLAFTLKEQSKGEELFFVMLWGNGYNYPDKQLTIQRTRVINDQDGTRKKKDRKAERRDIEN